METSQELEASYSLTYGERLRAAWDLTMGSPTAILWLCFFPFLGILLLWVLRWPASHNPVWDYFLILICFAFVPFMFLWTTYRAHREDSGKGMYKYRFDPAGVHVTTATSELTHHWPAISRVRENGTMLYLYFTERSAHCVPLRALTAAGATEAIRRMAAAGAQQPQDET
jgi:hypothetical protein